MIIDVYIILSYSNSMGLPVYKIFWYAIEQKYPGHRLQRLYVTYYVFSGFCSFFSFDRALIQFFFSRGLSPLKRWFVAAFMFIPLQPSDAADVPSKLNTAVRFYALLEIIVTRFIRLIYIKKS